jgi:hypothetical protein
MRLFIILFLIGVTIFGCDNRNTSEKFQELSEKLQPEKQSFEIDPTCWGDYNGKRDPSPTCWGGGTPK